MGLLDSLRSINEVAPFETVAENARTVTPSISTWDHPMEDTQVWLDRYATFSARPKFNPNMDGFISPYTGSHWGATSDIMQALANGAELGPLQEKLDPNKIFTSELAALKSLAADQIKVKKIFERRLLESLNDKGKFGLNEDDIEAMQALTSAASAIAAIDKEQIAVKKNIAELKIKQQQISGTSGPQDTTQTTTIRGSSMDVGRSIMDNIFASMNATGAPPAPTISAYQETDPEQAAELIKSMTNLGNVSESTEIEARGGVTYVVNDPEDPTNVDKAKLVTIVSDGTVVDTGGDISIDKIDLNAKEAYDSMNQHFPLLPDNMRSSVDAETLSDAT